MKRPTKELLRPVLNGWWTMNSSASRRRDKVRPLALSFSCSISILHILTFDKSTLLVTNWTTGAEWRSLYAKVSALLPYCYISSDLSLPIQRSNTVRLNLVLPPFPPPSPLLRLWVYLQISSGLWRVLSWRMTCTFYIWYTHTSCIITCAITFLSTLFTPYKPYTHYQTRPQQHSIWSSVSKFSTDHPVVCWVDYNRLVSVLLSVGTALVVDEESSGAGGRPGRFSRAIC